MSRKGASASGRLRTISGKPTMCRELNAHLINNAHGGTTPRVEWLTAVMPLQRSEGQQCPRAARDLDDLGERDPMISVFENLGEPALDPSRAPRDDGQARRGSLRLHALEGPFSPALPDVAHLFLYLIG